MPKIQADAVRGAFAKWKAVGIGLEFQEVGQLNEAEVRIGYLTADGSSASAVGRELFSVTLNEPTTVYGWDLTTTYGSGTALHELGHVLGIEHDIRTPSRESIGTSSLCTTRWLSLPTIGTTTRRITTS